MTQRWRRVGRAKLPPGKRVLIAYIPVVRGTGACFHWGVCQEGQNLLLGRWQDSPYGRPFYGFGKSKEATRRAKMHPRGEVRQAKFQGTPTLWRNEFGETVLTSQRMLVSRKVWNGR